jgi:hypothetical protein
VPRNYDVEPLNLSIEFVGDASLQKHGDIVVGIGALSLQGCAANRRCGHGYQKLQADFGEHSDQRERSGKVSLTLRSNFLVRLVSESGLPPTLDGCRRIYDGLGSSTGVRAGFPRFRAN